MGKTTVKKLPSSMKLPRYHTTRTNARLFIGSINPKPEKERRPQRGMQDKFHHLRVTKIPSQKKHPMMCHTYRGPSFNLLSNPSFTNASTPTPGIDEFSSLAMKTATTVCFSWGFVSPSLLINSVTSATCPRQSVVPRPLSLSPSILKLNGSNSWKPHFLLRQSTKECPDKCFYPFQISKSR